MANRTEDDGPHATEQADAGAAASAGVSSASPAARGGMSGEDWSLIALVVLSFVGFGIAGFSARGSFQYWLVVAPVFALISIYTAWTRARARGESAPGILKTQILHWLVLPIAVYLVYQLQVTGRLDKGDAGVVALLAIAITTFLAGVHFDWRLGLVGAALGIGAFGAAIVEEYFWIVGLVAVVVGGTVFWLRRK